MSLGRAIEEALEHAGDVPGTVSAGSEGASAEVDVVESDRLGVRVTGVRVRRAEPFDIAEEANALPDRLRTLPERLTPTEIAPELGGAVLRTDPDDVVDGEYFELDVLGERDLDLKRMRVAGPGEREQTDWTMTKKQLRKLVDEMG